MLKLTEILNDLVEAACEQKLQGPPPLDLVMMVQDTWQAIEQITALLTTLTKRHGLMAAEHVLGQVNGYLNAMKELADRIAT